MASQRITLARTGIAASTDIHRLVKPATCARGAKSAADQRTGQSHTGAAQATAQFTAYGRLAVGLG